MPTGNDIVAMARDLVSRGLRYASPTSPVTDDDPTHFDCSGFVAWIVRRQAGASVGTTSNTGFQYRHCSEGGELALEDAYKVPGALLFRNPAAGPRAHVAISVGDGQHTLEAMSTEKGVCEGVNVRDRGWTHAVLIPGVDYGAATSAAPRDPDCLLDTRPGRSFRYTGPKPGAGKTVDVDVLGPDAPPAVVAVMMNVTAMKATADGFVTVFPSGEKLPTASNLNLDQPGRDTATALVTVPIGAEGRVSVYTQSGAHLLAHRARWFLDGQGFTPLMVPTRLLDTRETGTKPGPDSIVDVPILGCAGVPTTGVSAAVLTVTGLDVTNPGFVTAWPAGKEQPRASSLNLDSANPRANQVIVPVGADGAVRLYTQSGAHLIVDVSGWFATTSVFNALVPERILDTRPDGPTIGHPGGRPGARGTAAFQVLGRGGVPETGVHEAVLNVTATNTLGPGSVSIWPSGEPARTVPIVSITAAGQTVPNLAIVRVGADGKVVLGTEGGADLIADVVGWTSA